MVATNSQITRWRQEWKVVHDEVVRLAHNRRMFREIIQIYDANRGLSHYGTVRGWMIDGYVALATMAVRRLVDRRSDVVSVVRILQQIAASPQAITRAWFVSQYQNFPADFARKDFDQFDPTKQGFVEAQIVNADLKQVQADAKKIEVFTHKYVAHRDIQIALGRMGPQPTWGELNKAIESLISILAKYELLLNQGGMLSAEAVIQEDWKAVFRVPWI